MSYGRAIRLKRNIDATANGKISPTLSFFLTGRRKVREHANYISALARISKTKQIVFTLARRASRSCSRAHTHTYISSDRGYKRLTAGRSLIEFNFNRRALHVFGSARDFYVGVRRSIIACRDIPRNWSAQLTSRAALARGNCIPSDVVAKEIIESNRPGLANAIYLCIFFIRTHTPHKLFHANRQILQRQIVKIKSTRKICYFLLIYIYIYIRQVRLIVQLMERP